MVMCVDVDCIYFHSFLLGIREDGEQRKIGLGDGPYRLSINSTSFYVSDMSNNNKFLFPMGMSGENMNMLSPDSRFSWHRILALDVTSSNSDRILVREVMSSNYDRVLKKRDAVFITFVSTHMCYSSRVTLQPFVHKAA